MAGGARVASHALGMLGALAGGAVGYWAFFWAAGQGFYALILPGGLLGVGCGLLARHTSPVRGVACGVAAVVLGAFTEWRFRPFFADGSFGYLLSHPGKLQPLTLVMIGVGGLIAFWTAKDGGFTMRTRGLPGER